MDPSHRYSSSLKKAKSFFEGKKKTPKGTPITQSQLLKLYQCRADCPICGTEFSGTNNNTEHIHPRALGGTNEATNKIQMCKLCNHCRNSVMQHHLIGPPYSKSYPQMFSTIQQFIMWSEITIDDGLEAGRAFPEFHKSFMDERFAGLTPPKGPTRAFGRASTLDAATAPNYPHNQTRRTPVQSRQTTLVDLRKKGFWERFATPVLDYLTGYGKEQPAKLRPQFAKKNVRSSAPNPSEVEGKDKPAEVPQAPQNSQEFVDFMLSILTHEPQELSLVGRLIENHLVEIKSEYTSPTYFLKLHGFPPGLKKAIETNLGSKVTITEQSGKQYVALSSPPPSIYKTKPPTKKCPEVDRAFQIHVLRALETIESEVKLATISTILEAYFLSIGEPKKSFKQFAKSYGIPANRTAIEVIDHYFPNAIEYRREGKTVVYVWLKPAEGQ